MGGRRTLKPVEIADLHFRLDANLTSQAEALLKTIASRSAGNCYIPERNLESLTRERVRLPLRQLPPQARWHLPLRACLGAGIDLDADDNTFRDSWPMQADMPLEIMECFAREGWVSAGAFWGDDAMHHDAVQRRDWQGNGWLRNF